MEYPDPDDEVIQEPVVSLKHPPDSCIPLANVDVAVDEVMFNTPALRPLSNEEVALPRPPIYRLPATLSVSLGVEVPTPTRPLLLIMNAVEVAPVLVEVEMRRALVADPARLVIASVANGVLEAMPTRVFCASSERMGRAVVDEAKESALMTPGSVVVADF